MHDVRTYWNHLLGPGRVFAFGPLFLGLIFNEKWGGGMRTYWNLLSSGWGCDTYLATAHPKGPVHFFWVIYFAF